MPTAKPVPLVLPFAAGFVLLLIVLVVVAFGDDPTPVQYTIYRMVIAIAGAGFAVALTGSLEVRFPLLGSGYVKATAAFAALVILYFFSPASLSVDEAKFEARRLIDDYKHANVAVVDARRTLGANWVLEKDGRTLAENATEPNQAKLEHLRKLLRGWFDEQGKAEAFATMTDFHGRIFDCVGDGTCDRGMSCREFFREVQGFRNLFCDRIIEVTHKFKNRLWERYREFTEQTCKGEFLEYYVVYDKLEDLRDICLPVQCWARNTAPPYPCATRQQIVGGMKIPTAK